jgi:hypothetical protein
MRNGINYMVSLEALLPQLQRMLLLRQPWAVKCTRTECHGDREPTRTSE